MKEGGGTFRARFGVERVVKRKVMENGQESREGGARKPPCRWLLFGRFGDQGRISGVHPRRAEEARLGQGSQRSRRWRSSQRVNPANPDAVSWSTDLSGGIQRVAIEHGCSPYGNGKARMIAWNLPDPIPVASRADLYPAARSRRRSIRRCRTPGSSACPISALPCRRRRSTSGIVKEFPLILSSGRLVEYEGGGEETRSNKWLAELKQDMYVEINPADASRARHRRMAAWVWVTGAEKPFQSAHEGAGDGARRQGRGLDAVSLSPAGSKASTSAANIRRAPTRIVLGESVNTLTTYGYDPATGMQEPKATLCQIRAA